MKKLFGIINAKSDQLKNYIDNILDDGSSSTATSATNRQEKNNPTLSNNRSPGKKQFPSNFSSTNQSSSRLVSSVEEESPFVITYACQWLAEAINEILANMDSEDVDNYQNLVNLITLLESKEVVVTDGIPDEQVPKLDRGKGCLEVLIVNIDHSQLFKISLQFSLATTLFQGLRLLRITELLGAETTAGVTAEACMRLCTILQHLCGHAQILEEIRPHLVKLFCFPISNKSGFHIQLQAAAVVHRICGQALTWQLIWFLHDNRVIQNMLTALNDLYNGKNNKTSGVDCIAEDAGLWLTGVQCIVELVASSAAISGVLVLDYEAAEGDVILARIIAHSKKLRIAPLMSLVMRLYLGCSKCPDVKLGPFPVILSLILNAIIHCSDIDLANKEYTVLEYINTSQALTSKMDLPDEKEVFLQNIAYSMLSLYSEDFSVSFKAQFSFNELLLFIMILPKLQDKDSVPSILTVASYVCQFYQGTAMYKVLAALCSMISYMTFELFQNETSLSILVSEDSLIKSTENTALAQVCACVASIAKTNAHLSLAVIRNTLSYFICNTLTQIFTRMEASPRKDNDETFVLVLLDHIFILLQSCLYTKSIDVFDEIRISNLQSIVKGFIISSKTSLFILKQVLRLHVLLCMSPDETHILESLQFLIENIRLAFQMKQYARASIGFETLTNMLAINSLTIRVWENIDGFDFILSILNSIESETISNQQQISSKRKNTTSQSSSPSPTKYIKLDHNFQVLLCCALKCISVALSSSPSSSSSISSSNNTTTVDRRLQKPINISKNRKYYVQLAHALVSSGIFQADEASSRGVVDMILGITQGKPMCLIANPGVVEILFEVLSHLSLEVAMYSLQIITDYIESDMDAKKKICDIQLVGQIVEKFHHILVDHAHPLRSAFIYLIRDCCRDYLTVSDFISLFTQIVRNDLLIGGIIDSIRALPPWMAVDARYVGQVWSGLQLLLHLSSEDSIHSAAPYVSFNENTNLSFAVYALGDVAFSIWFHVPIGSHVNELPIMSILNDDRSEALVSFTLRVDDRICVVKSNKIQPSEYLFRLPSELVSSWHLLTINFKRNSIRNKSSVDIYLNNLLCENMTGPELELKTSSQLRKRMVAIGAYKYETVEDLTATNGEVLTELWRCGAVRIFNDPLSLKQILHMYLQGPGYLGTFTEHDPVQELPSVYASIALLHMKSRLPVQIHLLQNIALSGIGLDLIADPSIDVTKHVIALQSNETLSFPHIEYQYVANNIEKLPVDLLQPRVQYNMHMVLNSATLMTDQSRRSVCASVYACNHMSPCSETVSSCIAALGGPMLLFPLLHASSTEDQLIGSLKLMCIACRSSPVNLTFMQSKGYRILSFILSLKSAQLLTMPVIDKLLDLAILTYSEENMLVEYSVLYDATAFYHLVMNHQIFGLRYAVFFKVLNICHDLVLCPRYAFINTVRLTSIGLFRWVLRFCDYSIRQKRSGTEEWTFPAISSAAAAECDLLQRLPELNNYLTPYFANTILQKIAVQEVNVLNFDPIQQMVDAIYSTFTIRPSIIDDENAVMSSAAIWRVLLLRVLIQILTDIMMKVISENASPLKSNVLRGCFDIVNIKFIVNLLLSVDEEATNCLVYRLFGIVIEVNPLLIREFMAMDGMKLIQPRLCNSFAFALPIIAIFLRIPMSSIPYAKDALTLYPNLHMELLSERSLGPNYAEMTQASDYLMPTTIVPDFILPLLHSILDCMHMSYTGLDDIKTLQSRFIIAILARAYEMFSTLKRYLVHRTCIEKLCSIISIYDNTDTTTITSAAMPFSEDAVLRGYSISQDTKELLLLVANDSIRIRNPVVVSYITWRSPAVGFNAVKMIVQNVMLKLDYDTLQILAAMYIYLIPAIKACVLVEAMQIELLEILMPLLKALLTLPKKDSDTDKSHSQKVELLAKDLASVARFLAISCMCDIQSGANTSRIVRCLDDSLELLIMKCNCEDASEITFEKSVPDIDLQGQGVVGSAVLDIFSKSIVQKNNSMVDSAFKSQALEDARAMSKLYLCVLIYACIQLRESEKVEVKRDMCRIVAFVCIRKLAYIRKLFGPLNEGTNNEEDVASNLFRDGPVLLLPDKDRWNDFLMKIRNHEDDEDEVNRIQLFFRWAIDSSVNYKHLTLLRGILLDFFPDSSSLTLKKVNLTQLPETPSQLRANTTIAANKSYTDCISECTERKNVFKYLCRKWLSSGFSSLASGAIEWKYIWNNLMSGCIWGDISRRSSNRLLGSDISGDQIDMIKWKLDILEGFERSRTRMEQNLFDKYENKRIYDASIVTPVKQEESSGDARDLFARLVKEGIIRKTGRNTDANEASDEAQQDEGGTDESQVAVVKSKQKGRGSSNSPPRTPPRSATRSPPKTLSKLSMNDLLSPGGEANIPESASATTTTTTADNMTAGVETEESSDAMSADKKSNMLIDIVKGIVGPSEWLEGKTANVQRMCGMESYSALLIITATNIHILRGFSVAQVSGTLGAERRVNWEPTASNLLSTTSTPMKQSPSTVTDSDSWLESLWKDLLLSEFSYHSMPLHQVYTIYKKRYELKLQALEIMDTTGYSLIFSCNGAERADKILKKLLQCELPQSIFNHGLTMLRGLAGLAGNFYNSFLSYLVSQLTKQWQNNELSNFQYLMHLNAASGRSYHDLTQYPVMPWIIANYTSSVLDLENPATFRDLSKPMGAIGQKRAQQYQERFESMKSDFDQGASESKPFHYGTHYSCAGYVLHYLVRLQPYSNMAIELQGGTFDKPDRLFRSIEASWSSAAGENLQDVKELIPEFFTLPTFLRNANNFDLGTTQAGDMIQDVILPAWAHGDEFEFIKKHREALESRYVSEHLHEWIDLIFGYKQRGQDAEDAMNVFIPLTYAGEVDIDAITDHMYKSAVLSQINNFGQTPSRLFIKPHPRRIVPDILRSENKEKLVADTALFSALERITPPLCVIGASQYTNLTRLSYSQALKDMPIGDICLTNRDKYLAAPVGCLLLPPRFGKLLHYKSVPGRVSLHDANILTSKVVELSDEMGAFILHSRAITCACASSDGRTIATGSEDMTARIWSVSKSTTSLVFHLLGVCVGHMGTVTCIDICREYSLLVTGSFDQHVCCWDTIQCKLIRILGPLNGPIESVSINKLTGNIAVLTGTELYMFTINGKLLAKSEPSMIFRDKGCVVSAPRVLGWQDGVVAVTGHEGGNVHLWRMRTETEGGGDTLSRSLFVCYTLMKSHKRDITSIKLCHVANTTATKYLVPPLFEGASSTELFVGDLDGYVSRWGTSRLIDCDERDIEQVWNAQQLQAASATALNS